MTAEDRLQAACIKWFDYAYPSLRLCLFAVPNGGKRHVKTAVTMKLTGTRAGVADLIFYYTGTLYCFELKTKKGTQQATQKDFETAIKGQGGKYQIIRSLDEFMEAVNGAIRDFDEIMKTIWEKTAK